MGKDFGGCPCVTGCHGPLSGVSRLRVPEQVEPGWELILTPTILNNEIYRGFRNCFDLPAFLFGDMVGSTCPTGVLLQ